MWSSGCPTSFLLGLNQRWPPSCGVFGIFPPHVMAPCGTQWTSIESAALVLASWRQSENATAEQESGLELQVPVTVLGTFYLWIFGACVLRVFCHQHHPQSRTQFYHPLSTNSCLRLIPVCTLPAFNWRGCLLPNFCRRKGKRFELRRVSKQANSNYAGMTVVASEWSVILLLRFFKLKTPKPIFLPAFSVQQTQETRTGTPNWAKAADISETADIRPNTKSVWNLFGQISDGNSEVFIIPISFVCNPRTGSIMPTFNPRQSYTMINCSLLPVCWWFSQPENQFFARCLELSPEI